MSDETGPENLKLDRGEVADIDLILRNAGSAVGECRARLVSRTQYLTVLDGDGAFPATPEAETTSSHLNGFRVSAAATAPVETPLYCDLLLTGSGYCDTILLPLVVGDSMNLPAGPDQYGYAIYDYSDSCYDRRPEYEWIELRGVGTELLIGDDDVISLPLPSCFGTWRYYGVEYDSVSVCTNGWIAPGSTDRVDFVNVALPYERAPGNIVAVAWDDLYLSEYGHIWFLHDSANHRLIVEYDSVAYFGHSRDWEKVQVHVYDRTVSTPTGDNSIVVQFATVNHYSLATVGLQNRTGTIGLTHVCNDLYPRVSAPLTPGTAIRMETYASVPYAPPAEMRPHEPALRVEGSVFTTACAITAVGQYGVGPVLAVHDPTGRLVRELSSPGGDWRFVWDGTGAYGQRQEPGVYFVRLVGPGRSAVAKVVLLGR